jgi:hypothetical protein
MPIKSDQEREIIWPRHHGSPVIPKLAEQDAMLTATIPKCEKKLWKYFR